MSYTGTAVQSCSHCLTQVQLSNPVVVLHRYSVQSTHPVLLSYTGTAIPSCTPFLHRYSRPILYSLSYTGTAIPSCTPCLTQVQPSHPVLLVLHRYSHPILYSLSYTGTAIPSCTPFLHRYSHPSLNSLSSTGTAVHPAVIVLHRYSHPSLYSLPYTGTADPCCTPCLTQVQLSHPVMLGLQRTAIPSCTRYSLDELLAIAKNLELIFLIVLLKS